MYKIKATIIVQIIRFYQHIFRIIIKLEMDQNKISVLF